MNDRINQAGLSHVMKDNIVGGRPVVLVSHGFQSNYERGFTNGLADNGVDVTLVSSDRTDYAGLRSSVRTLNLRGSQNEDRPRWVKAVNLLRYHAGLCIYAARRPHSIFHVIGLIHPPLVRGLIEGLWFRLICWRYVLTIHNLLPHEEHTALYRRLYGLCFRVPHRLVVHTPRMREELVQRYGLDPKRIAVMEHGIEPLEASEIIAHRVFDPRQRMKILFFGIVADYKGLDVLLQAMEGISDQVSLLIAGVAKNEAVARDITARIAKHPAHDHITWQNRFIQEREVAALFKDADVLALPYRYIDQSGVLFQALRYGLPVVATRVGSFHEYVTDETGELCAPDNPLELRQALIRLRARLPNLPRARIAEIGRLFAWSKTVNVLASAYV